MPCIAVSASMASVSECRSDPPAGPPIGWRARRVASTALLGLLVLVIRDLARPSQPLAPLRQCERTVWVDGGVRCDDEIPARVSAWCEGEAPASTDEIRGGDAFQTALLCAASRAGRGSPGWSRMPPDALEAFGQPVWINEASAEELRTLPRIGPALASRIIAARPFERLEDLLAVRGIGPSTLEALSVRGRVVASGPNASLRDTRRNRWQGRADK